jgi:hypothetical protein
MAAWGIIPLFADNRCNFCSESFFDHQAEKDLRNEIGFSEQYDT